MKARVYKTQFISSRRTLPVTSSTQQTRMNSPENQKNWEDSIRSIQVHNGTGSGVQIYRVKAIVNSYNILPY